MKYLKKFENYDLGRFAYEEDENPYNNEEDDEFEYEVDDSLGEDGEFANEIEDEDEVEEYDEDGEEYDEEDAHPRHSIRKWGDEEIVEKKKMNAGFKAYLDKQKDKKADKGDDKKGDKKGKPDFLDKKDDKDKKDKKDDKKGDKGTAKKGLSKAQLKLPKAMQDAILKKQK